MSFKQSAKLAAKRIIYQNRASSDDYIKWLKKKGITIGEGTRFFDPLGTEIDVTQPSLVTIGKDVMITQGVIILTHGFDWFVLNGVYGDILGSAGEVTIGNNVFLGSKSIILKDVHIGNNVIVGAGSVVTKNIPDNMVVAGNPAKVLCTLDKYYEKRKKVQLNEAVKLYKSYKIKQGGVPNKSIFHEFFWLFEYSDDGQFEVPEYNRKMNLGARFLTTYERYTNTKRCFECYEDFCSYCEKQEI